MKGGSSTDSKYEIPMCDQVDLPLLWQDGGKLMNGVPGAGGLIIEISREVSSKGRSALILAEMF